MSGCMEYSDLHFTTTIAARSKTRLVQKTQQAQPQPPATEYVLLLIIIIITIVLIINQ